MFSKCASLLFVFLGFIACKNDIGKSQDMETTLTQKEFVFKFDKALSLTPGASSIVAPWKEYQNFDELLNRFKHITSSAALSNSEELNSLATYLKDSVRVASFKIPSFQARLNVLQNETMRLQDMITISNLKPEDIKDQIAKVFDAFNATNAKLNNMVSLEAIENKFDKKPVDSSKIIKYIPNKKIKPKSLKSIQIDN